MKREVQQKLHGAPHLVPLPRQAVAVFRELHELTGRRKLVFRGERHHDRPMSNNTINAGFRAMGFAADEVVMHGYRATARTMLHERLGFSPDVIEAQLAHSVRDNLGRAYNRTEFIEQRRAMLQRWADYLDELRQGPAAVALGPTEPVVQNVLGRFMGRKSTSSGIMSIVRTRAPNRSFLSLAIDKCHLIPPDRTSTCRRCHPPSSWKRAPY
jgi:hypothetical protein